VAAEPGFSALDSKVKNPGIGSASLSLAWAPPSVQVHALRVQSLFLKPLIHARWIRGITATVTDEDFAAHFLVMSHLLPGTSQSSRVRILDEEAGDGELQFRLPGSYYPK
jgi:hypothetical protein